MLTDAKPTEKAVADASGIEAQPFPSLDQMRAFHTELLTSLEHDDLSDSDISRVRDFLARGAATGKVLDVTTDRSVAQGLLNYWTATLYTQRRSDKSTALKPPAAVLLDFDTESIARAVERAEALVAAWPAED